MILLRKTPREADVSGLSRRGSPREHLGEAALLIPTPASLGILLFHYLCVRIKALDEERYLLTVHGDAYRDFCRTTGRLLPKLWR